MFCGQHSNDDKCGWKWMRCFPETSTDFIGFLDFTDILFSFLDVLAEMGIMVQY
jgi:hypothetical protein